MPRHRQTRAAPGGQTVRVAPRLGDTLRRVREESDLSIRELARMTGVSPATVQKIENNNVSPTVTTLFKIARGLNKTVSFFVDEEKGEAAAHVSLTPRQTRTVLKTGRPSLRIERIVGNVTDQGMDAHCLAISPGEGSGKEPLRHQGEEIAICLRGQIEFRIGKETYRLNPGDTLYFKATLPHAWSNPGPRKGEMILIFSPPAVF